MPRFIDAAVVKRGIKDWMADKLGFYFTDDL